MQIASAALLSRSAPGRLGAGTSSAASRGRLAAYAGTAPSSISTKRACAATQAQAARTRSGTELEVSGDMFSTRVVGGGAGWRLERLSLGMRSLRRYISEPDSLRRLDEARMEQMRQQLDAVDQPRAGARKGGGGVDGEEPVGAEGLEPVAVLQRLRAGVLQVPAAGHRDDQLGREPAQLLPLDLGRLLPGAPGDVPAAGDL